MVRPSVLSLEKWVEIGLTALSQRGHDALKADLLSKDQGVTRGSFYYHFANVADFHSAVIARWKEAATLQVISDLQALSSPRSALERLLYLSFSNVERLERQMRLWAESDPLPKAALAEIDTRRIGFLTDLLGKMGHSPVSAVARANIIYDCYIGRSLRRAPEADDLDNLVAELVGWCSLPTARP